MRQIVQHDIVTKGCTFEQSVENLSQFRRHREGAGSRSRISLAEEAEKGGSLVTVS